MSIKLTCQYCNKEYFRTPLKATKSKFCSNQCMRVCKKREDKEYNCKICNKQYIQRASLSGKTSFCSYECMHISNRSKLVHLTCTQCKKKYTRTAFEAKKSKYCSLKCLHANTHSWLFIRIKDLSCKERFDRMSLNFERHVVRKEGCWEWAGQKNSLGYSLLSNSTRLGTNKAYRHSWAMKNGKIPKNKIVRHLCNNPECTNPDHLAIGTHQDNCDDMTKAGRQSRGSKHPTSKLNENDVIKIRTMIDCGLSCASIARTYSVSHPTIRNIKKNVSWKHVKINNTEGLNFESCTEKLLRS